VWYPGAFLVRRFSATDKKYVLKAFPMICGLLDNWLFTFMVVILLLVFLLLVMVLTMFPVVFGLLDYKIIIIIFFADVMTLDKVWQ
jgi:hypothetical protein